MGGRSRRSETVRCTGFEGARGDDDTVSADKCCFKKYIYSFWNGSFVYRLGSLLKKTINIKASGRLLLFFENNDPEKIPRANESKMSGINF